MGVLDLTFSNGNDIDWEAKALISGTDSFERYIEIARANQLSLVPFDIRGVIQSLNNVNLVFQPLSSEISGYFKVLSGSYEIGINSKHHPFRQRFTMGHELGHYALHRNLGKDFEDKVLFRDGDTNSREWEANQFAAELLMPKTEFRAFLRQSNCIDEVSDHFQVSALAIKVRAIQLGFQVTH